MKKLFITLMAIFLLINSVGYTVYAHYCDDELKETSLIVNTNESCCEEEADGQSQSANVEVTEMSCCAEQDVLVKIEDQFVKSESTFNTIALPTYYLNFAIFYSLSININPNLYTEQHAYLTQPPEIPLPKINISYSIFRI